MHTCVCVCVRACVCFCVHFYLEASNLSDPPLTLVFLMSSSVLPRALLLPHHVHHLGSEGAGLGHCLPYVPVHTTLNFDVDTSSDLKIQVLISIAVFLIHQRSTVVAFIRYISRISNSQ